MDRFTALVFRDTYDDVPYSSAVPGGGGPGQGRELLSSAEVFSSGRWTMVGSLPVAARGLAGATLDTGVFMAGRGMVELSI